MEDERKKIVVYDGCLEWHQNKQFSKDRSNAAQPLATSTFEMEVSDSNKKQRHYDSISAELEFRKNAGRLTTMEKFSQEARIVSRTLRDNFLYLPTESGNEIKRLVSDLVRKKFSDEKLSELSHDIDAIALSFRVFQKTAIKKIMTALHAYKYEECDPNSPPGVE
ncbi:MAG: hypothetical protein EOP04_26365 [Proteobacteria bacterium]|nr:MAG: hypothetical protein EOP04_26365 [Pseudomonadota bacterium]